MIDKPVYSDRVPVIDTTERSIKDAVVWHDVIVSGVQPGVLPLSARGRHLPSSWTHHFTPHTCAPTHHSQLFPMCGLFMHLSPVPLPAEITSTSTNMCMFVFHCVCNLTDYIRFRALRTPALRCRLRCPVLDYCFVFACWLLILLLKWPYLHLDPDLHFSTGFHAAPWQIVCPKACLLFYYTFKNVYLFFTKRVHTCTERLHLALVSYGLHNQKY